MRLYAQRRKWEVWNVVDEEAKERRGAWVNCQPRKAVEASLAGACRVLGSRHVSWWARLWF